MRFKITLIPGTNLVEINDTFRAVTTSVENDEQAIRKALRRCYMSDVYFLGLDSQKKHADLMMKQYENQKLTF